MTSDNSSDFASQDQIDGNGAGDTPREAAPATNTAFDLTEDSPSGENPNQAAAEQGTDEQGTTEPETTPIREVSEPSEPSNEGHYEAPAEPSNGGHYEAPAEPSNSAKRASSPEPNDTASATRELPHADDPADNLAQEPSAPIDMATTTTLARVNQNCGAPKDEGRVGNGESGGDERPASSNESTSDEGPQQNGDSAVDEKPTGAKGPADGGNAASSEEPAGGSTPSNDATPIIESASATTSPDNANSGYRSYVITILALLGILFLCMGLWNCTSSLVETGIRSGLSNISQQWGNGNGYSASPYGSNGDSSSRGNGSSSSSLSVSDALDLNLDLYSNTISSNISASDYAGTPNSMRSYVLSIVHTDSDHNSAIVADLNAASAADDPRSDVEQAVSECDSAITELNNIEVPSDTSSESAQSAQSGKEKAVARWQAIQEELKLLDTQDDISYSDLQKADNEVAEATTDAASVLTQALTQAAESR